MSMIDFAKYILGRANNSGRGVTNLHLQKIMYFALIDAVRKGILSEEKLSEIYTDYDGFEVWPYGPVEVKVYKTYKRFGSTYIVTSDTCEDEQYQMFDEIIDDLLETDVFSLVDESHTHQFWKENINRIRERKISKARYSVEDIMKAAEYHD